MCKIIFFFFFFSSRRRHTRLQGDWSSDVCSSDLEAAILTVDGVGEWTTASMGLGKGTDVRLLREIRFPHSLGLLYSAFTAFLGFEVNEGEYKVMGMAPFGKPRYVDKVHKLIGLQRDGSFELNMDYFSFHWSTERTFSRKFVDLFGAPRDPAAPFFTPTSGYPSYFGERPANYDELAARNQYYADVAASIQAVTEEALLNMVRPCTPRPGWPRSALRGGGAPKAAPNGATLLGRALEGV